MKTEQYFIQGNEACARGAIKAGCRFFAGYPITPSTEIAEDMAVFLPREGGTFIQMEDEISALGAVIGAVWGGMKGMTATSGPGFSLMQEHIGYAAMTETPIGYREHAEGFSIDRTADHGLSERHDAG